MTRERPDVAFHALTRERWPDVVGLFRNRGNPGYCWCMRWRAPSRRFTSLRSQARELALRDAVWAGTPTGILAYQAGKPVGWCSVAPRETYVALERSRTLPRIDSAVVWSVVCFFVVPEVRGRGLASRLLDEAVSHARDHGAEVVEGYPVEPDASSYRFMGFRQMFESAGFRQATPENGRILRRDLRHRSRPRPAGGS